MRKEIIPQNGSQKVHQFPFGQSCRQGTENAGIHIPAINRVTGTGLSGKKSLPSLKMTEDGYLSKTPRIEINRNVEKRYKWLLSKLHFRTIVKARKTAESPFK